MITGAAQMDGAILVVSAADGLCLRPVNIFFFPVRLVFQVSLFSLTNAIWWTTRLIELVEMELRELLNEWEFPGDDTPFIRGSALEVLECAN